MNDNELNTKITRKDGGKVTISDLAVVMKVLNQSYKALAGEDAELLIKDISIEEENKC